MPTLWFKEVGRMDLTLRTLCGFWGFVEDEGWRCRFFATFASFSTRRRRRFVSCALVVWSAKGKEGIIA